MKTLVPKKSAKQEREHKVLLGLVDFYLTTGKPVGSNTLKEAGFGDLSSATIRNYFAGLEEAGYLIQQHTSGGRIPTDAAYRVYAEEFCNAENPVSISKKLLDELRTAETKEIASYLQKAAEILSDETSAAVFLSAPRFDQDYITDLRLVPVDQNRCLCVIITDFGVIQTEVLPTEKKLSAFTAKRIESYFHWRLTGNDQPENLEPEEEKLAQTFWNEVLVRYIVGYSNFTHEEIYRTGFSKLLNYPEFHNPTSLAVSLSLFENAHSMRLLLKECSKVNHLKYWIGSDLHPFTQETPNCSVIAIPYHIAGQAVGAIGVLGSTRIPYRELFGTLRAFSESISTALTRSIYKFKISFRQPQTGQFFLQSDKQNLMLLEDNR